MKRLFLMAVVFAMASSACFAQADYEMWQVIYIKPKLDKVDLFRKALAAHNKKYHATGANKVGVSSIITGPNSGEYVWVMGPTTWTKLDGAPGEGEHTIDLEKNINPNCESIGETMYWRGVKEVSYESPGSAAFKKSRMRASYIYPGQMERFIGLMKQVVEVCKVKKYPGSFAMAAREGLAAAPRPNAVTFTSFDKWAFWDSDTFAKDFEEVNGSGSWHRFLEEIGLCMDRTLTYDEMSETVPELGG